MTMRTAPKTLSIPVAPIGSADDICCREVAFIKTRTPGIVITPAQRGNGRISFDYGCNLTHAPSGFRLAGTFQDVGVARAVAGALNGIMEWDGRDMSDHRVVVVCVRSALRHCPELLAWIGALNDWEAE